jgi:integrase
MPRAAQGPYVYERKRQGRKPVWVIIDGKIEIVAEGAANEPAAKKRLGEYLAGRFGIDSNCHPTRIAVAEILDIYAKRRAAEVARPELIGYAIAPLQAFFANDAAGDLKSARCEAYVAWRCAQPRPHFKNPETAPRIARATARRELGVLAAAANLAFKDGILTQPVPITLAPPGMARERHLSRSEVAALLWGALGFEWLPDGRLRRHKWAIPYHLCRFILIAVYTGTRHDAILKLRWMPSTDSGWIDLEHGLIYRRGADEQQTKKRRPPLPIPVSLLPHLRRWHRMGTASGHVIEFDGARIAKERTAWNAARARAGLDVQVTPHILRHTCATWLLQKGRPVWEVAGYLGTSEQVIRDTYGHHAPDYLREAAKAL